MFTLWFIIAALVECNAIKPRNNAGDEVVGEAQYLTNAIVSTYFSEARCIGFITERPDGYLRVSDLPVYYITLNRSNVALEDLLLTVIDAGCLAFILQVHDVVWMVEKFAQLFHSPTSLYRANRRYLYLPPDFGDDESSWEALTNEVFNCKSMDWMPEFLIVKTVTRNPLHTLNSMIQVENSRRNINVKLFRGLQDIALLLEIYTHKFVGRNPSEKVLLDAWIPGYGFLYDVDLFSDKLHNLMGKELKMISIPYPPFTVLILDVEPPVYDGLEFQAMFEFGKKFNVTWTVLYDLKDWWGEVWDNGSGNGLLGAMAEDKVDFAFCAFYLWYKEFFYMDYSMAFYRSGLTTVAPKPKRLPTWLIPVRPFNNYMWCAVLASVIIVTIALYIASKSSHTLLGGNISSRYSTLMECGFRAAGLLVLQVPDDERDYSTPRYVPLRHLVTWIILFFLVISSAYAGGLSAILTLPQFQSPIDTAKDLAESGLRWCGVDEVYIAFLKSSTDPVMKTITGNFVVHPEDELVKLAFDDIALVVERLQGGHFADVKYIFEEMMEGKRLMKEDLAFGHCVFAFRKGSPYKENLNALLYKLRGAGIPLYWEGMSVRKYLSQRQQLSVTESRSPPEVDQTKLAFTHVQGAFYLLAFGLLMALITFLLELVKAQCIRKKKRTYMQTQADTSYRGPH